MGGKIGNSSRRPDVLFLFTDDQRFNTINALGNEDINTPNMDTLVEEGVSFTNAHIMGGSCPAVCMPSRAMMLTGRNLFDIEGHGENIPKEHKTIPETFHDNGYDTFGTGKWHNGTDSYTRSFSSGSKVFFGGMDDHWNVPVCDYHPEGEYPSPKPDRFDPGTGEIKTVNKIFQRHETGTHSTELFVNATIDFLKKQGGKPFFAYASFMAPHDPRNMPRKYLEMYEAEALELPENFLPRHPFDNGELLIRDEKLANLPRKPEEIKRHLADYYAMITHIDAEIGRLFDFLKDKGRFENTIIILAGDNGLALGQHGLMGKQNLYDHSVRVPLIFRGPGIPEGERFDTLCYLYDIYPTLCEAAGLPVPDTVNGRSLLPLIRGEETFSRKAILCAYKNLQRSIKTEGYKLIEYSVGGSRHTQLFDLGNDPGEINDLSTFPKYEDKVRQMKHKLYRLQKVLGDPDREDFIW